MQATPESVRELWQNLYAKPSTNYEEAFTDGIVVSVTPYAAKYSSVNLRYVPSARLLSTLTVEAKLLISYLTIGQAVNVLLNQF